MNKLAALSLSMVFYTASSLAVKYEGEYSPAFSPDGNHLAYHKHSSDMSWDIMVKDLNTGKVRQVTQTPGFEVDVDWSPDGTKLVYAARAQKDWDIHIYDLQRQKAEALVVNPGFDHSPSWSKDGKSVLFLSTRDGSKQIYKVDISSKKVTQLSDTGQDINHPSMSVDGRHLIFDQYFENPAGEEGRSKIFQLDVSNNNIGLLYETQGSTISAQRNGNKLFITNNASGNWDIIEVDLVTGKTQPLANEDVNEVKAAVSHQGDKIAYSHFDETGKSIINIKKLRQ